MQGSSTKTSSVHDDDDVDVDDEASDSKPSTIPVPTQRSSTSDDSDGSPNAKLHKRLLERSVKDDFERRAKKPRRGEHEDSRGERMRGLDSSGSYPAPSASAASSSEVAAETRLGALYGSPYDNQAARMRSPQHEQPHIQALRSQQLTESHLLALRVQQRASPSFSLLGSQQRPDPSHIHPALGSIMAQHHGHPLVPSIVASQNPALPPHLQHFIAASPDISNSFLRYQALASLERGGPHPYGAAAFANPAAAHVLGLRHPPHPGGTLMGLNPYSRAFSVNAQLLQGRSPALTAAGPVGMVQPMLPNSFLGPASLSARQGREGGSLRGLPCILALPEDNLKLSPHQVLLRHQIEAFKATDDDISTHTRGRNKPIMLGQVGIRCRHCAHLPVSRRQKGSTYFPAALLGLYQAAQNMSTTHMQCGLCSEMPLELKQQFAHLISTKVASSGAGRPYWAQAAKKLGLVDTPDGIRFITDVPPQQVQEGREEKEGSA